MKAMRDDRDVRCDEWPDVAMDGIYVKTHRKMKESVLEARAMRGE